ncbi:hypothetical protein NEOLEDRAFT_603585 [Neolentinus lepideus HHB14362 ss-1]|uniref:Uncharacterized protein n=1 Tax=Neolentinus lepideus HHB14362 ss-1 TaxID=1314782 RepID=A0A165VCD3_9AGAM|nr:hypothetical protein NEOLEDRAFT_603585 [Neolentinus lepideus HHB14362 ss-1]
MFYFPRFSPVATLVIAIQTQDTNSHNIEKPKARQNPFTRCPGASSLLVQDKGNGTRRTLVHSQNNDRTEVFTTPIELHVVTSAHRAHPSHNRTPVFKEYPTSVRLAPLMLKARVFARLISRLRVLSRKYAISGTASSFACFTILFLVVFASRGRWILVVVGTMSAPDVSNTERLRSDLAVLTVGSMHAQGGVTGLGSSSLSSALAMEPLLSATVRGGPNASTSSTSPKGLNLKADGRRQGSLIGNEFTSANILSPSIWSSASSKTDAAHSKAGSSTISPTVSPTRGNVACTCVQP